MQNILIQLLQTLKFSHPLLKRQVAESVRIRGTIEPIARLTVWNDRWVLVLAVTWFGPTSL